MSEQMDKTVKILKEFMVDFLREASDKGVTPPSLLQEKIFNGELRKVAQNILYDSNEEYLKVMDAELRENTNALYELLSKTR